MRLLNWNTADHKREGGFTETDHKREGGRGGSLKQTIRERGGGEVR